MVPLPQSYLNYFYLMLIYIWTKINEVSIVGSCKLNTFSNKIQTKHEINNIQTNNLN